MEANKKMTKFTTYTKYSNGRTLPNFWEQMNEEEEIALLDGDGLVSCYFFIKFILLKGGFPLEIEIKLACLFHIAYVVIFIL